MRKGISKVVLQRLPIYLNYLKELPDKSKYISATVLAEKLDLGQVQVRKDLASVSKSGKPKVGYEIGTLIAELEGALGYNEVYQAVIVGAGRLGKALLDYKGFADYGLNIAAGFDKNPDVRGETEGGKGIYGMDDMPTIVQEQGVRIGIITVPSACAQDACDKLVECGIKAIWNFSAAHLTVPTEVLVKNENMAISLSLLAKHLANK